MQASTQTAAPATASDPEMQRLAREHLWMHFTRMGSFGPEHEVPIIVRGEGCYVWDDHGNRYLDGLSALFCVNSGHGRAELGDAMAAQVRELDFITDLELRAPAGDRAGDAHRLARARRPQPRLLHQQRLGGGRVGAEAGAQLPPLPRATAQKHKLIAREIAYHGTTLGALSRDRDPGAAQPVRAARAGRLSTSPTPTATAGPPTATRSGRPTRSRSGSCSRDPETVAAVILEPLQNAGGCIPPQEGYFQRVREICDRHDVLLISDEVICAWGRLGHYFGCERYGYQPDIVTVGQGADLGLRRRWAR